MKQSGYVPDFSVMPKPEKKKKQQRKRKAPNDLEQPEAKKTKRQQAIHDKNNKDWKLKSDLTFENNWKKFDERHFECLKCFQ